jgi:hypothetical protein
MVTFMLVLILIFVVCIHSRLCIIVRKERLMSCDLDHFGPLFLLGWHTSCKLTNLYGYDYNANHFRPYIPLLELITSTNKATSQRSITSMILSPRRKVNQSTLRTFYAKVSAAMRPTSDREPYLFLASLSDFSF